MELMIALEASRLQQAGYYTKQKRLVLATKDLETGSIYFLTQKKKNSWKFRSSTYEESGLTEEIYSWLPISVKKK